MSTPNEPVRSSHVVSALLVGVLAVIVLVAGIGVLSSDAPKGVHAAAAADEPAPLPVLTAAGPAGPNMAVPWRGPLSLSVTDGTLKDVTVTDPDGAAFTGSPVDDTTWRSTATTLLPDATYRVTASAVDRAGEAWPLTLAVHTTPAEHVLHAVVSPGPGSVVGVGMPVIVTLNRSAKTDADRAAVLSRLKVVTTPAVAGAWRWMDNRELHYRGPSYWTTGTKISVGIDLRRLQLSDGTWGYGTRHSDYRIGDALISTVDVSRHIMAIRRNGQLLRIAKVSTGRDKYPTKGGVHIVLEKTRVKVMDSATVGIPRNSPDGYFEKVPFSVRISNSGEFVHSADWSVRDQGVRNVSHGCVNMSPADAEWFFGIAKRGDVVTVINANAKPTLWDAGTSDWNIPFDAWAG